ncbi:MAG: hypothetical protein JNK88_10860 [Mangrovicoccus sp.]|nr:hypothetical protein [Mangrovicoccus sp.]
MPEHPRVPSRLPSPVPIAGPGPKRRGRLRLAIHVRPAGAALAAVLLLAACADAPGVAGQGAYRGEPALRAIRVASNHVVIAGPKGYCVDPRATREARAGAFVLLAGCAALDGRTPDARTAVLTASVSPEGLPGRSPGPDELGRFFRSAEGRAALAQDGRAESLTLGRVESRGGVLFLRLKDASRGRPEELGDDTWRAVFALNDRIVSLSASSLAAAPVGDTELRRTLERFVAEVKAANGQRRDSAA